VKEEKSRTWRQQLLENKKSERNLAGRKEGRKPKKGRNPKNSTLHTYKKDRDIIFFVLRMVEKTSSDDIS